MIWINLVPVLKVVAGAVSGVVSGAGSLLSGLSIFLGAGIHL